MAVITFLAGATTLAQAPVFRSSTALVIQTVTVTDRDGRPIEGLTAADFRVTEDNVAQSLVFVEFEELRDDARATGSSPRIPVRPTGVPSVTAEGVAAPRAREARYRDYRLLVFYFDMAGMAQADQFRAFAGANTFLSSQMGAADLVAVMEYRGSAVRLRQDFTDDREHLRRVVFELFNGKDKDGDGLSDVMYEGSDFGQNRGEFNFLRTDRQLAGLQTAIDMLKVVPQRKTLMYFVSGLTLSGLDNQAQLSATINAAIRSNVSVNPIDARGLVAAAPLGGANVPSPAGLGMFTGSAVHALRDRFERSQDVLHGMAKDTGGTALFDYNDLALGIRRAAAEVKSYYILGYHTARSEKDGRFRRINVTLTGRPEARLAYRAGYFAEKEFAKFTGADRERQLEEALILEDPITDIPMAAEVNYFQLNGSEYFVPVSVKIAGQELASTGNRQTTRATVDLIGEVKNEFGVTIQNVRDKLDIPLTAELSEQLAFRPLQYETGFTLLPGLYSLKLLVRSLGSGRIGTFMTTFLVPNLLRDSDTLRMSSVVLSGQVSAPGDSLFSVRQNVQTDAVNPLVVDGTRLLPSVTRVFTRTRDLQVLFHVYRADAVTTGPIVAFVSLFKAGMKISETEPIRSEVQSAAVPFRFRLPLAALESGDYECQVSVLDLGRQKVKFWRAPVIVVP
jgi:VWFA-related protein